MYYFNFGEDNVKNYEIMDSRYREHRLKIFSFSYALQKEKNIQGYPFEITKFIILPENRKI